MKLRVADMNYKGLSVSHSDRDIINEDRGDGDKRYLRERMKDVLLGIGCL